MSLCTALNTVSPSFSNMARAAGVRRLLSSMPARLTTKTSLAPFYHVFQFKRPLDAESPRQNALAVR
jgi:hypothetical protein